MNNITYTKQQWIDLELVPMLGGYEEDFDLESIADEALEYDENLGGLTCIIDGEENFTKLLRKHEKA